ncbi:MAG: hypothetical protein GKS06_17845 [Acidobacteria bacterium]|nr:hypothetical protein [Acidobacteriota bacterium]
MTDRRLLLLLSLAFAVAACGSPLENAAGSFMEQIRLGDPAAQQTYAESRELLESAEALPIWTDAVANADSPQVRRWAATLLGNIGDASSLPVLSAAMSDSREVRDAAIDAIGQFDPADAAGALAAALTDGTRDAQTPALAALARMGDDAAPAVDAIGAAAASDESIVASTAVNTLADIGTDGAIAALNGLATDTALDMGRRKSAIQALQRIEAPGAAAALTEIGAAIAEEEGADDLRALF